MLYSFQSDVLFVHVSRTGGTSIKMSMEIGLNKLSNLGSSQHAPLCEARAELGELFDSTYKFAIVRNPWDRLVSWYSFISSISIVPDLDSVSQADPDASHWKEFDAYLDETLVRKCSIDGEQRLELSQFHQLADSQGKLLIDGLGRFESLAEDMPRLLGEAKLRCPPLKTLNQSSHQHYSAYYSDYGRQLVEELLKDDVDCFGYQFDLG
jgi:chondroitin 4-sulfotransferase 11